METATLLRLPVQRMLAALTDAPHVEAAELRAVLADPTRVELGTVARISGLSGVPAHKFFEGATA